MTFVLPHRAVESKTGRMSTTHDSRPTAVIVFESMFGSTRRVAEAIAEGMSGRVQVSVTSATDKPTVNPSDVLIVGAPTHAHSLSRPESRREAVRWAQDSKAHLTLEADGRASGIREWLEAAPAVSHGFAAFDTRVDMPRIFTGSAATVIAKRLRKQGNNAIAGAESFLVDKDSHLLEGELERARHWGARLADTALAARHSDNGGAS